MRMASLFSSAHCVGPKFVLEPTRFRSAVAVPQVGRPAGVFTHRKQERIGQLQKLQKRAVISMAATVEPKSVSKRMAETKAAGK